MPAGLLRYNKNAQLAIITVEIKLEVLSLYIGIQNATTAKRPSCLGGNFTREKRQDGKNLTDCTGVKLIFVLG